MNRLLLVVAMAIITATSAQAAQQAHQLDANRLEDQARVRSEIALQMARVRSLADLHNFVASNQGKSTALDALSPVNRRTFIDSLTFNEKGITGFSYAPLEGLSASQAYAILSLFGVERLTPRLKGIRAYNQADKLILSPSNAAYPSLMKDYDGYYCAGRASCAPRFSWICTGNC